MDLIREEARSVQKSEAGNRAAKRFFDVATGAATFIRDVSNAWLAERGGDVRESVRVQQAAVIKRYLQWAGEHATIEETKRRKAGEYVSFLRSDASGIKRNTAARYISTLSTLWRWLGERGYVDEDYNPWRGHRPKRSERQPARSPLSDAALCLLLTGTPDPRSKYGDTLHDLVRLGLVTGARLDELCGLRRQDVERREDGWWLLIRRYEGHPLKSKAAERDVPLHASAAHIVQRLLNQDNDQFLFADLTPGGPDKRRSWNVSRAFSAYRKRVGVKGRGEVFHAMRNTFAEALEGAGVPESTAKLLMGHARPSLTFGRYSAGERVDLRGAIDKLAYSAEVMRLIAEHTTAERTACAAVG